MLSIIKNKNLLKNGYLVDGTWLATEKKMPVINPYNQETITTTSYCGSSETLAAIKSAQNCLASWKNDTARSRADLLMEWYHLLLENKEDLAKLITLEQGKPLTESQGEVVYASSFLRWFAEEGVRSYGDLIPTNKTTARIVVNKKPVGVVGIITPWNFPIAMITRKVAPALVTGCTCIIKPSEITPLTAIALCELGIQAGLPDGVINLVFGDAPTIGDVLTESNIIRKISFTGSTKVGRLLMKKSAPTIKRLSLELGGNAPFIVFEDANLDKAVSEVMVSKFRNTGQTCVCANRIFVQNSVMDKFIKKLVVAVSKLKVADGFEVEVTQGPLINEMALEKVENHIKDAVSKGAKIVVGGKRHEKGGWFHQPTILKNVTLDANLNQEETFGPVAPLIGFDTDEEVIKMANNTEFGLAAYFCTQNLKRAWVVAEAIDAGIVGINEGIISSEVAPFGGVKQSGLGREGSKYGLDEYLENQYILMGIS